MLKCIQETFIDPPDSLTSRIVGVFDDDPNRLLVFACHTNDRLIAENAIKRGATLINYAVFCASMHNHKKLIKYFIKKYRNDEIWNNILHGACMGNQKRLVNEALNNGADDYQTAFECACLGGNIELMKKFMTCDTNVNTGFQQACLAKRFNVIEALYSKLTDIPMAFTYACYGGNMRLIQKLMIDVEPTPDVLNKALLGVAQFGTPKDVWTLLDSGANDYYNACINAIKGGHEDVIEIFDYHVLVEDAKQACLEGQKREIMNIASSIGSMQCDDLYESCLTRRSHLMKMIQLKCYDSM